MLIYYFNIVNNMRRSIFALSILIIFISPIYGLNIDADILNLEFNDTTGVISSLRYNNAELLGGEGKYGAIGLTNGTDFQYDGGNLAFYNKTNNTWTIKINYGNINLSYKIFDSYMLANVTNPAENTSLFIPLNKTGSLKIFTGNGIIVDADPNNSGKYKAYAFAYNLTDKIYLIGIFCGESHEKSQINLSYGNYADSWGIHLHLLENKFIYFLFSTMETSVSDLISNDKITSGGGRGTDSRKSYLAIFPNGATMRQNETRNFTIEVRNIGNRDIKNFEVFAEDSEVENWIN
ncbi:MAG: hypothetical protein DRP06_04535, partial [Candidatus Aenigmatarchaeota archaeon]